VRVYNLGFVISGRSSFSQLISNPFRSGLHTASLFAIAACVLAAITSWSRGTRYVAGEVPPELDAYHVRAPLEQCHRPAPNLTRSAV